MSPAGFDLTVSAGERPQTYAVDRAATETTECTKLQYIAILCILFVIVLWHCRPTQAMPFSFTRFLDHTQRRITFGRTPLDEWSARRGDLYLTTYNSYKRQLSMPPLGFELTIRARERSQTFALDRAATGIRNFWLQCH